MLNNIFMISLSMSAVILLLLIISPLLHKRYPARWRYFVWLIVALRLVIPFKLELPLAPVNIPAPQNQTIVFRQEGIPFTVMDENYVEMGNASSTSADYAPIMTLQELLAIICVIGTASFLIYHIASYIIFKRKIMPYCSRLNTEILCNILEDMKIKKKPQLLECSRIASPMMIGFFKPTILLPNTDYSNDELTVILKHELTHYKRGDLWYKLMLIIANAMHWFNPFVYFMARAANRDLEYSCDDAVVRNSDIHDRKLYSMTILKAMENGRITTLSTSFSESGKSAKRRFENILNTKAKKTGVLAFVSILIIIGIIGVLIGFNANNHLYICKTFECSFELPQSWAGKYETQERNNNIVYVYHKAIRETYGEGTGLLFYIEMLEGDNLTHDDITDPGNRTIALQENGYTYVFGMPTDVQYPVWEGGDKALADDYVKMTKDHDTIKKSIRRAVSERHTAVLIKDAELFSDDTATKVITTLKKNDLVYVIYDQNDDFYYVQNVVMSVPSIEGYMAKATISFDEDDYKNANYGSVLSGTIYKTPNENDIYRTDYIYVFHIIERRGEWVNVDLIAGDDNKWVKTSDISYELTPHNVDLTYTHLQREIDNGHQPWRLDPLDVARDYVYNTLNKRGGEFEVYQDDSVTGSITYSYTKPDEKEIQVTLYQPIKKDNSGIWTIHTSSLIQNQIENVIPADKQIVVNSGMAWRIHITDKMDFINNEYGEGFNLEQEAKKLGINIYDYYGHDLDVYIYSVETSNHGSPEHGSRRYISSPYIFVFKGTDMIAYKDLEKQENERIARDIMITLHQHSNADE